MSKLEVPQVQATVVSGNNLLLQLTATGAITYNATCSFQSATGGSI